MILARRLPLPLRTERLVLRTARADDLDDVLAYCGDEEVTRYLPFGVLDREAVQERMARWAADLARDPASDPDQDWILTLLVEFGDTVIGDVMLRLKPGGECRSLAELGYVFNPAYAGLGLATEAARAVVDLAFDHLGCHRVYAMVDPRNVSSVRLCERLGMQHEAHLREDYWGKGEWSDTGIYGVLREEWYAAGS